MTQLFCTSPRGVRIHVGDVKDGNAVTLAEGVNDVDDDFAATWLAEHRDGEHKHPLIVDGTIFELPKGKKATAKKEAS